MYLQPMAIPVHVHLFVYIINSKYRITMAKAAFNKKRALLISILDWELRKKLVKCYMHVEKLSIT